MKFSAEWCGPCQAMKSDWNKITETFKDVEFETINVDDQPGLAQQYGVMSIPTIVLVENGQVIDTIVGRRSVEEISSFISNHVS